MSKAIPELRFSELTPATPGTGSSMMGFTADSWVAAYRNLGPVFTLKEAGKLCICGEELSRELWKRPDDWSYANTSLGQIFQSELGTGYITASDGDYHRAQRRMMRPLFTGESIYRHLGGIDTVLAQGLAALADQEFDLHDTLIFLYTKGLNRTMVQSTACDAQILKFARFEEEFIRGGMLQGAARTAWYERPEYVQLRADVMDFFRALVRARLAGERTGDNLDRLIDVMKQQPDAVLSEQELLRDAYVMQAAGAGNMASMCCTLLWLLVQNEAWLTQLGEEFKTLDPRQMLKSGISGMPFTRNFMLETERMFPVTPGMLKLAVRDMDLSGYPVKAGTEVLHLFVLSHFLDEHYEEPLVFKPWRWSEGGLIRPHAFGGGEHMCIGMNLAYLFVVMTLRLLLADYRVTAVAAPYLKPVSEAGGAPLRTAFDIRISRA